MAWSYPWAVFQAAIDENNEAVKALGNASKR